MVNLLDPKEAEGFVRREFAQSPDRLLHILEVAKRVQSSAKKLSALFPDNPKWPDLAYCAALLHDIGYIEEAVDSGFHPIDGCKYLGKRGYHNLGQLIVGHSNSPEQAGLLGIDGVIASDDLIAKLITYWDVQVLQGGQVVDYDTRFNEIVARYGDNHIVSQAHFLARPRIKKILAEVDELLDKTTLEMNSLAVD